MKKFAVLLAITLLSGCGTPSPEEKAIAARVEAAQVSAEQETRELQNKHYWYRKVEESTVVCINNTQYLAMSIDRGGSLTPLHMNPGALAPCEGGVKKGL